MASFCSAYQIVNEVGEGPHHGDAGEGDAEKDHMQEADAQDVRQPHSSAVHHPGVGVDLAVCRAHIHDGVGADSEALKLLEDVQTPDYLKTAVGHAAKYYLESY